jgi:peptidyl-prolyl cis-trans isomerase A (cyclophilin A)
VKKTILTFCVVALMGLAASSARAQASSGQAPAAKPKPAAAAHSGSDPALLKPATLKAQAPAEYDVKFVTTKGDFVVHVTRAWAPLGADRFYNLVKHGFFNGASFFRFVDGFVVQFGLTGNPAVNKAWNDASIKDDPVKSSNKPGFITFAMGGKDTRTTQVFINLGDNSRLDSMGFAPFGEVTSGMDVVKSFYSGYADAPTSHQGEITNEGKAYLDKNYPKLDSIKTATIVPSAATSTPAASNSTGAKPAASGTNKPKPAVKPQE